MVYEGCEKMKPTVYLLCGLPGLGKSTISHKLQKQNNAVAYSSDEWIIKLFGQEFSSEEFQKYQAVARQKILEAARTDLLQRKSIILDFGFWKQNDRTKYINWAKSLNAEPIIYFFNTDTETLIERLAKRKQKNKNKSLIVTKAMLHAFIHQFEPPTNKEAKIIEVKN